MKAKILLSASLVLNCVFICLCAWSYLANTVYQNGFLAGQQQTNLAITNEIEKQFQTGQLKINIGGKETVLVPKK